MTSTHEHLPKHEQRTKTHVKTSVRISQSSINPTYYVTFLWQLPTLALDSSVVGFFFVLFFVFIFFFGGGGHVYSIIYHYNDSIER